MADELPAAADPFAGLPTVVLVTGTSTAVGKTVATAVVAGLALARGEKVAVYKPAQTGVAAHEPGDVDETGRLLGHPAGLTLQEGARLPDPLAPSAAARRAGRVLPTVAEHAVAVRALAADHDLVLIEGAGGLLVELDSDGGTLADLGVLLRSQEPGCGVLLVCAAGLGTLNHTALTAEALRRRRLELLGLIVGSWPADDTEADIAMQENLPDLPRVADVPLLGRLPEGLGAVPTETFVRGIPGWFTGHRPG